MADLADEVDRTNVELEEAERVQKKQFEDTKLRFSICMKISLHL